MSEDNLMMDVARSQASKRSLASSSNHQEAAQPLIVNIVMLELPMGDIDSNYQRQGVEKRENIGPCIII